MSESGLRLVGVKGAHRIPALGGGASESVGERFLPLPPGETEAILSELLEVFIMAGIGLAGDFVSRDALVTEVFESGVALLAEFALERGGDLTLMVSFLSLIIPLRRILRGVEVTERSE